MQAHQTENPVLVDPKKKTNPDSACQILKKLLLLPNVPTEKLLKASLACAKDWAAKSVDDHQFDESQPLNKKDLAVSQSVNSDREKHNQEQFYSKILNVSEGLVAAGILPSNQPQTSAGLVSFLTQTKADNEAKDTPISNLWDHPRL